MRSVCFVRVTPVSNRKHSRLEFRGFGASGRPGRAILAGDRGTAGLIGKCCRCWRVCQAPSSAPLNDLARALPAQMGSGQAGSSGSRPRAGIASNYVTIVRLFLGGVNGTVGISRELSANAPSAGQQKEPHTYERGRSPTTTFQVHRLASAAIAPVLARESMSISVHVGYQAVDKGPPPHCSTRHRSGERRPWPETSHADWSSTATCERPITS